MAPIKNATAEEHEQKRTMNWSNSNCTGITTATSGWEEVERVVGRIVSHWDQTLRCTGDFWTQVGRCFDISPLPPAPVIFNLIEWYSCNSQENSHFNCKLYLLRNAIGRSSSNTHTCSWWLCCVTFQFISQSIRQSISISKVSAKEGDEEIVKWRREDAFWFLSYERYERPSSQKPNWPERPNDLSIGVEMERARTGKRRVTGRASRQFSLLELE